MRKEKTKHYQVCDMAQMNTITPPSETDVNLLELRFKHSRKEDGKTWDLQTEMFSEVNSLSLTCYVCRFHVFK